VTGSYDYIAIGSDIDGYIKPALKGLGVASGLRLLEQALIARYGQLVAGKICYGNARRVLAYWAP
jgi:microsomal dipeptidase-like Zn-dependent dipeptidase